MYKLVYTEREKNLGKFCFMSLATTSYSPNRSSLFPTSTSSFSLLAHHHHHRSHRRHRRFLLHPSTTLISHDLLSPQSLATSTSKPASYACHQATEKKNIFTPLPFRKLTSYLSCCPKSCQSSHINGHKYWRFCESWQKGGDESVE